MNSRPDDSGPDDVDYVPSDLVEDVLMILEEAGMPETLTDKIVELIEGWEDNLPDDDE